MDHMEFSIALPVYVECTNGGVEWADMKQRLNLHSSYSSDFHQHHEIIKTFLINIATEQVHELFNVFGVTYDEAVKFSRILQRLEDVCLPRFLIIYNRYKFFTCRQSLNDKFDDFLRDLLNWSKNCEFGDLKDILLKDCIITGITDNLVRRRLLETEELDFLKTIEICKAVEQRQRVKNVAVGTHQICPVDACNNTENIEKHTFESGQVLTEYVNASTNTAPADIITEITETLTADCITNVECIIHDINMGSEDDIPGSESNDHLGNIHDCATELTDLASKLTALPVLRHSERHNKFEESSLKIEPEMINLEYETVARNNNCKQLKETVTRNNCKKPTVLKIDVAINKSESCKELINSSSGSYYKLNKSGRDSGINKRNLHKNVSSGKKLELSKTRLATGKTQDYNLQEDNFTKIKNSTLKTLIHKHKSEETLICSVCDQSFSDKIRMLSHVQNTHARRSSRRLNLKCRRCKAVFSDVETLKKHRFVHKNEKKFKCDYCHAKFANPSHLRVHTRLHTGERPYSCDTCGACYPEASKLKAHMRRHTGEKPFQCSVCDCTFAWTAAYTRHMRTHTGERPYTCEFCGVNFADFTSLQRHIRTHTQEKPYKCEKCSAKFTDPSALKLHNRIHNGERPYVCGICGTSFIRSQHLKEHTKLHTGEKPFECETCGAKFTEASKLKSHRRKHTGEKPYLCKICGARFAWTAAFTRHMRIHTKEKPYVCDFCGRHYADHSTLTRHQRTHTGERPYICKTCSTDFADNSSLHRHMKIHIGEKSYTCEVCGSSFAVKSYLVRHMRTHTGEKPHGCDLCGSKFTDSSKLNRHRKIHFKVQVKHKKQENPETTQQEPQYEQLQPVQQFPAESVPQPVTDGRSETWNSDQHFISSMHPVLITTLLPVNFNSPIFS